MNVKNIVNKVYPEISKDYSCTAKVEIHNNIYERLSGIKGMSGSSCAQAEYKMKYIYILQDYLMKKI